jgi:hypothetical protein
MHLGVGLDHHQLVDPHRAGLTDAAKIVALEIDEHDVLGPFLGMGTQLLDQLLVARVVRVAPACAGNRSGLGTPLAHAQEPFR